MRARLTLILALCLALTACTDRPSPNTDTNNTPRIIALSPGLAAILTDLGLEQHIVGRHDYDPFLRHLPACGHQEGINYERLVTLRPTHVLLEWGRRDLPPRLLNLAERNNWRLHDYQLLTLDDIAAAADDIAQTFNIQTDPTPGERLLRALDDRSRDLKPAGRVLLLGSLSPPAAFGPGSYHADIITRIGATPAITAGSPWIELSAEDILQLAPDAIVLILPRSPTTDPAPTPHTNHDLTPRLGRIATLRIPAVEHNRIALIDDTRAHIPSTALADLADQLADILADWAATNPANP